MRLIYSSSELEVKFLTLIKRFDQFYWTTAWAGINSSVYNELCKNESKIKKITVGIHFYQTHPSFIERFLRDKRVKFIKQPEGTFHPKFYLFYNSDTNWELLIGSANFTKQAFSKNTEATILVSSKNEDSNKLLTQAFTLINLCWKNGEAFNKVELDQYTVIWKIQQKKFKGFANGLNLPLHQIDFAVMPWGTFLNKIKKRHNNTLNNRLKILELAREFFEEKEHFSGLSEDKRSFIAGIYNKLKVDGNETWACFGSMIGAGKFKKRIKNNDKNISKALDQIPLYGQVTEAHYTNYTNYFKKSFPGNSIATFSRLLAMKRPDIFYCITSANQKVFCNGYDIIYSRINYKTYWDEIVMKIINSEWWVNPNPKTSLELEISNSRAAFLDAFCYQE